MSRHRNVRSMNYTDEYDGYDDVYGHSVEEGEFCMSPSQASFMYDREASKGKQKIGAFFQTVTDIAEENEGDIESKESNLSETDRVRLASCVDEVKRRVGSIVPRNDLANVILVYNFDVEKAVNFILDSSQYKAAQLIEKKDKDVNHIINQSSKNFTIPKFNDFNTKFSTSPGSVKFPLLTKTNVDDTTTSDSDKSNDKPPTSSFATLSDLTSHHLHKVDFKLGQSNKINFNTRPFLNPKVQEISKGVSLIRLNENKPTTVKSESWVESNLKKDSVNSNWHVDLTKALKLSSSLPLLENKLKNETKLPESEDFIPQFVDCEIETENIIINQDPCCMSIKYILSVKHLNYKKASKFGKVLCRNYKRNVPYFIKREDIGVNTIKAFCFDVPSPDDIVSRHLPLSTK